MAPPATGSLKAPRIDDLVALNEEIVALVRAGVPLERGLALLADDLPGQLGRMAQGLSQRMSRGQTLSEAFAGGDQDFPEVYRAVVQAGARSGHLAVALEGLTVTLRRMAELRVGAGIALLYPVFVLLLAWILFCLFVVFLVPQMMALDVMGQSIPQWFLRIRASAPLWGPLVPAAILVVFLAWWFLSARAVGAERRPWMWLLAWIPSAPKLRRYGCLATFAEVLSLLVDRDVPLPEAVRLAAASSGDWQLDRSGRRAAEALERGQDLATAAATVPGLPPYLALSSFASGKKAALVRASRQAADSYGRRAERLADWLALLLPVLFTVLIGATVTIGYALVLFWPWFHTLENLALP